MRCDGEAGHFVSLDCSLERHGQCSECLFQVQLNNNNLKCEGSRHSPTYIFTNATYLEMGTNMETHL